MLVIFYWRNDLKKEDIFELINLRKKYRKSIKEEYLGFRRGWYKMGKQ